MKSGIYCILNLVNGKRYIGQSTDLEKRRYSHFRDLNGNYHNNIHLQNAFNQYGESNFEFKILVRCVEEELDDLERYYIKKFDCMDPEYGYNNESGGIVNKKLSNSSINKMSKSISSKYNTVGFYRVHKQNKKDAVQGFVWCYRYHDNDGKRVQIRSTDLIKVKEKVLSKNLDWFVVNEELAKKSIEENRNNLIKNKKENKSGFYRTYYDESTSAFTYQFSVDSQHYHISRSNLDDLKHEVLNKGWPWKILDENKANKTIELNKSNLKIINENKKNNQTGFYKVYKNKCGHCKQGFHWIYYADNHSRIRSIDLCELKEKVLAKGFTWKIIDKNKAKMSIALNEKSSSKKSKKLSFSSGFLNVYKIESKDYPKGFCWKYYDKYIKNEIFAFNLDELKSKVLDLGYEWKITNKNKAKKSLNLDNGINRYNARNKTGFLRVSKHISEGCKNGIIWTYEYKNKSISSVDLLELKNKVLDMNWEWKIVDEDKANESLKINTPKEIKTTNSGFYKVSKTKCKRCVNGFTWSYYDKKQLRSTNLLTLRDKVLDNDLEWKIIDEEKARASISLNKKLFPNSN